MRLSIGGKKLKIRSSFYPIKGFKALTENLGKPNFKIGFPLAQRQVSHLSVDHCSRGLELPFAGQHQPRGFRISDIQSNRSIFEG